MKIIQITDTHLLPPGRTLHGIDPADQLARVIADVVARHADANLVAITGDLCNDGDPEAYALLRALLAPLACPVRLMLGNHDARPAFRDAFPDHPVDANGFVQSWLDAPQGRLLFLDSHHPGTIGGRYCTDRRAWLEDALKDAGPVAVFIHHPPVPDGLAHFDNIRLHDMEAVTGPLRAHAPGVAHIVFGHIHVPLAGTSPEGFAYSSGQSCAHRFVTAVDDPTPWWTDGPPCYRVLHWDALGFRAYTAQVGERRISRGLFCAGP